jgi:hypothetical protein
MASQIDINCIHEHKPFDWTKLEAWLRKFVHRGFSARARAATAAILVGT